MGRYWLSVGGGYCAISENSETGVQLIPLKIRNFPKKIVMTDERGTYRNLASCLYSPEP